MSAYLPIFFDLFISIALQLTRLAHKDFICNIRSQVNFFAIYTIRMNMDGWVRVYVSVCAARELFYAPSNFVFQLTE